METNAIIGFEVRNRLTGDVKKYAADQRKAARRYADKCDNAYGSYICSVTAIYA